MASFIERAKQDNNQPTIELFTKLCDVVGVDVDKVNMSIAGWHEAYAWTNEEENQFISWLSEKMLDQEWLKAVFTNAIYTKDEDKRIKTASKFVLAYGWTTNAERAEHFRKEHPETNDWKKV